MDNRSQRTVEAGWQEFVKSLESGVPLDEALGEPHQWQLTLGDMRLLLHPATGQWFYWDQLHDEYAETPLRCGQGVLFTVGGDVFGKALPEATCALNEATRPTDAWFLVRSGTELHGPLTRAELLAATKADRLAPDAQVWSTGSTRWRPVSELLAVACASCGSPADAHARFCRDCGAALSDTEQPRRPSYCSHCGVKLGEDAAYCSGCGYPVG